MSVHVEMTEEECARRWLASNNMIAVKWSVMEKLVESQLAAPVVCFDAATPTYVLLSEARERR